MDYLLGECLTVDHTHSLFILAHMGRLCQTLLTQSTPDLVNDSLPTYIISMYSPFFLIVYGKTFNTDYLIHNYGT